MRNKDANKLLDDALERLNQLTNQSKNARKDLFKVQENALRIRLNVKKFNIYLILIISQYERNHRSLSKINSDEKDSRIH